METESSFEDALTSLGSNKRDPRSLRLAAVASALLEIAADRAPSNVYAKAVTALEGTLAASADTIATQVALLELLQVTIPHVPTALLTATLPMTSRVLRAIVTSSQEASTRVILETKDELGGVNSLLRWSCKVVTSILMHLVKKADEKTVKQLMEGTLLLLFEDRRPKVRKEAHGGVTQVVNSPTCHTSIRKVTTSYAHTVIKHAHKHPQQNDALNNVIHLLSFLEHSITCLNTEKLAQDVMELLIILMQQEELSDFVARVKEETPKILTISAILSTVTLLLNEERIAAPRVLASLLQSKPALIFRSGRAEMDILQRGQVLFGQCLVASCGHDDATAYKLLPLAVQLIVALCKPDDTQDNFVAQTLMVELTQLFRSKLTILIQRASTDLDKCLVDCLQALAHVTDTIYRPTWGVSLKAFVVLLQSAHHRVPVQGYVEVLLKLRSEVSAGSPSQHAIDDAFSSLVQGVGIEACWRWVAWQPTSADGSGKYQRMFVRFNT
jgi:hypothetical protein